MKQCVIDCQTMPFDWCNTNKVEMIIETLDNHFSNFFDYDIKDQSSNFDNVDNSELNIKSFKRLITKNKMIFPHEAVNDVVDEELFREKYTRRIQRFVDVVKDEKIHKIFIRADNKSLNNERKQSLIESLDRFGVKNYEIRFISYDLYPVNGVDFNWKRLNINWLDILK